MQALSDRPFGYLIAFGLPGFLLIWGLSFSCPAIATWLAAAGAEHAPTIAGFLYTTVASFSLGLLLDTISSNLEDIIYATGWLKEPQIDDQKLKDKDVLAAFQAVIDNHYRYFQCYSSSLLVLAIVSLAHFYLSKQPLQWFWYAGAIFIAIFLITSARNALYGYGERAEAVTQ